MVYIGSPPQSFALIVDTGSTITYVPCSSCSHCGTHQNPSFKPEESSTYTAIHCDDLDCELGACAHSSNLCNYARHYAEQSFSSGFLARDIVRFGKGSSGLPRPLLFGCETTESGNLFLQHADGIMGLGRGSLSVVDQLITQGAIASTFSLCYGGMDEDGGALILGSLTPIDEMVFTPSNPTRSSYYNVVLKEIWVEGVPLPVKPSVFDGRYGTILDSGTTFAYLPAKAFDVFKDAFVRGVKDLKEIDGPDENFQDICYSGAGNDPDNLSSYFPSIDFVFGDDKAISLAAENYLFRHPKHAGAYCLGFFQNEDSTTILGGIVARNMLVTYDREEEQIGFVRTKCTDLWKTLSAEARSASDNDSSIPPFANGDTDYEWINPSMPYLPPNRHPVSDSPHSPHQNNSQPQGKNHSDTDVVPKKRVHISDACSLLSFQLYVPFVGPCLRHLHVPLMVILVSTLWK
ncbi:hypothetical protein KC19_10G135800 [Ceratodon purpureus]|nr:hypothetical protein KC19_10G135800 [Ceratodon purpureus]